MHSRHAKVLLKYISCLMFLKFQKHVGLCFFYTKLTLDVMGQKFFSRACEPLTIVKLKSLYKFSLSSYS